MSILHLVLDIYFVFALGVAGIAKLDTPSSFASILRYQYKIPVWSIGMVVKIFPWIEIVVALSLLLTIPVYKTLITFLLLFLFLFFLAIRLISHWRGLSVKDCGCYGQSIQQSGLDISLGPLIIQVFLALLLLATTLWGVTLPWAYSFVSFVLVITFYCWLLRNVWQRRRLRRTVTNFFLPLTLLSREESK
jgi:hypothetical protein